MALVAPNQNLQSGRDVVQFRDVLGKTHNARVLGDGTSSGLKLMVDHLPVVAHMTAPANGSATAGSGGSLNNGTYTYKVTAFNAQGEQSLPTSTLSATTSAGAASGKVTLAWDVVPGAVKYRVYGRSGTVSKTKEVTTNGYVDLGTDTPDGTTIVPTSDPGYSGRFKDNVALATSAADVNKYFHRV